MVKIKRLSPPIYVKGVRSLLGHAGFYRRSIKDFSKIFVLMCRLLEKDSSFHFDDKALGELKQRLVTAPINIAPDRGEPFELLCDASDIAIGAILGLRKNKVFHSIYYARTMINQSQINYAVIEKKLLAVVWVF